MTPLAAVITVAVLLTAILLAGAWAIYEMHAAPEGEEDEHGYGPVNPRPRHKEREE